MKWVSKIKEKIFRWLFKNIEKYILEKHIPKIENWIMNEYTPYIMGRVYDEVKKDLLEELNKEKTDNDKV